MRVSACVCVSVSDGGREGGRTGRKEEERIQN